MQVFKLFMRILKKKLSVAMTITLVFLSICVALTLSSGGKEESFEESSINICIFDEDNTPESKALAGFIGKKHNIKSVSGDRTALTDALYYGSIEYALTINEGYGEKLSSGDTDGLFIGRHIHDSYGVAYMDSFLDEYVSCVRAYIAGGEDISDAMKSAENAMDVDTEVTTITANKSDSLWNGGGGSYFRYLPYVMLSAIISALAPVMMAINSKEVRFRTNCSAIRPATSLVQILLGSMIFVTAVWLMFMLIGIPLSGGMYSGIGWYNVLNSFLFAMISAVIAVMVSLIVPSVSAVNIVSNVICLSMSFLCGVFVPMSLLSDGVQAVGRFLPAYWYIKANAMITGTEMFSSAKIAQYLGIEAGFAIALAAVTMLVFKLKLRSNE